MWPCVSANRVIGLIGSTRSWGNYHRCGDVLVQIGLYIYFLGRGRGIEGVVFYIFRFVIHKMKFLRNIPLYIIKFDINYI